MKIWLITDTHFGHDKMVQYCGRPENFNELIVRGLNVLDKDDILIHLGDICIGRDAEWHQCIIQRIGCKKILVRGNHDKKSNEWYMSHGWDFVCESFSLKIGSDRILFSHEPKHLSRNDFNIHGHFHNNLHRLQRREWAVDGEEERNREILDTLTMNHINLSIEETNYKPILLSTLLAKGVRDNARYSTGPEQNS